MSEWYEPKSEDIDIDPNKQEVDIFVKSDSWGAVYITLTFDQINKIKEIIDRIK